MTNNLLTPLRRGARLGRIALLAILIITMALPGARPAYAAGLTVDSTADAVDANPGNGVCATATATCTLRAAIQEANALAGADTITLPAGIYARTVSGSNEEAAATGDLDITDIVTIAVPARASA